MRRPNVIVDVVLLSVFIVLVYVYLHRRGYSLSGRSSGAVAADRAVAAALAQAGEIDQGNPVDPQQLVAIPGALDARIRRMRDARSKLCREKRYSVTGVVVSIIIDFFDYQFHDLKMTLGSLLANTEMSLIHEIIIVDDGSTLDYIVEESRLYMKGIKKGKLVRKPRREGAIRARQSGVAVANGSVFVFLDTTVICNRGWLEPLLDAVAREPTSFAVPHYDNIHDPVSYEYRVTSPGLVATFSWSLQVRMAVDRLSSAAAVADDAPRESPALRGNVFAVSRAFFTKLTGYDVGFRDAGGEHLELALRAWMCGGAVRVLPCARVGVLNLNDPVRVGSAENAWRITELWLAPMRDFIYRQTHANAAVQPAWIAAVAARRKTIAASLRCESFDAYKQHAGRSIYAPAADTTRYGLLRVGNGHCMMASANDHRIEMGNCSLNYLSEKASMKVFEYHANHALSVSDRCLSATNEAYVELADCSAADQRQQWSYDAGKGQLVNDWSRFCLMHVTDPNPKTKGTRQVAMVQACGTDTSKDKAFSSWEFVSL